MLTMEPYWMVSSEVWMERARLAKQCNVSRYTPEAWTPCGQKRDHEGPHDFLESPIDRDQDDIAAVP